MFDIMSWQIANKALKRAGWIGDKATQLTNIQDGEIVEYDSTLGKFINTEIKTKAKIWQPNKVYEQYEIVVWDNVLYWVLQNHTSHKSEIEEDVANGKIMPFAKELGLANIRLFDAVLTQQGTKLTISWTNPTAETFSKAIGYISSTVDITTMQRTDILALVGTSVEQFYSGGDVNTPVSVEYTTQTRKHYYIKIFAEHQIDVETKYSGGRYMSIHNPDIYPPEAPTAFTVVLEGAKYAKLTWTKSIATDLFTQKIVRSAGVINTPQDGTIISTLDNNAQSFIDYTVQPNTQYNYAIFAFDDAGNGYEYGKEGNWSKSTTQSFSFVPVYGFDITTGQRIGYDAVQPEDFNHIAPWSNVRRAIARIDGTINYYLSPTDSTKKIDGTNAVLDGSDGEVVVEKPAFYYNISNGQIMISEVYFNGSTLSPRTLIGFAPATLVETQLSTVVGQLPIIDKSVDEFRTLCPNGWNVMDYETLLAIRAMFLVEYGAYNSQILIGRGIVDTTEHINSGATMELGNRSGNVTVGSVSYRGIENLWGNQFQLLDGLIATDTAYYTATTGFDSFINETNTGTYTKHNITPITNHGFISKMEDLFVGKEVLGDSGNFVGDHQYGHTMGQENICAVGGRYDEGDKAGLFRNHFGLNRVDKMQEAIIDWEHIENLGVTVVSYTSDFINNIAILPKQTSAIVLEIVKVEVE